MTSVCLQVWLLAVGVPTAPADPVPQPFEVTQPHMGVPFRLLLYAADQKTANSASKAAFSRVKQLNAILSDYDADSELSRLSRLSGQDNATVVSADLWRVLVASQALSRRTDGAFDVTVGPVVRLWRRARRSREMPDPQSLSDARALVGYQLVELEPDIRAVRLARAGMRLDLGGIAKGYAADEALQVLRAHGVASALVDAGGDLTLGDPPPGRDAWRIGIAPLTDDGPASRFVLLHNAAIATSGDAWQFVEIDGVRYSHLVDPQTGLGITGRNSVTVIAADCITADSLASAVTVLGPQRGLRLIEQTPGAAAIVLTAEGERVKTFESSRIAALLESPPAADPTATRP